MALYPIHNFFVLNNEIKPRDEFIISENEGGIYEVLRIVNGIPLFLEDHLDRFYNSAKLANKEIRFSKEEIKLLIRMLIETNKQTEGNILISCKLNLKLFFINHNYPAPEMYQTGVTVGVLFAERENPNAKVFQTSVRQKANLLMEKNRFYEVLLIDQGGRIKEGSRSNVFFIQDNLIITPPGNEVLLGITRKKAIDIAEEMGMTVREEDIIYRNLASFQAAFITGTSPKLLPIKQIGEIKFNPKNKEIGQLIKAYNELILRYVS